MSAIIAWRITKKKYAATAFDGLGASKSPGRWNSHGVPMIYIASSLSLAQLEMLVNLDNGAILAQHYVTFKVEFPNDEVHIINDPLPTNWADDPPPYSTRAIGDNWISSKESLVLEVPSAVTPGEINFLVNPGHPAIKKLAIHDVKPFSFDLRIFD